jgi:biofilm PGA synthesis protein PgaA
MQPNALGPEDERAYRRAIEDARAGRTAAALAVLQPLTQKYPQNPALLGDNVVVLGWSGADAAALEQQERIDRDTAPAYVLEGLAASARRQQRYELAEALYLKDIARFPQRLEPRIGIVRVSLDAGRLDDATRGAGLLRTANPRNAAVLEAYADVATARRDYFDALGAYQTILNDTPAQPAALRGKAQTLSRLGAPQLALEVGDSQPGLFSAPERNALLADGTAHRIRWGSAMADQGHGPERFAGLDRALAESDAVGQRALSPDAPLTAVERQLALDRIMALQQRVRMRDAVALYEAMAKRPEPMPAYTQSAAASAYLYLQQPERSRDLYRQALAADPANVDNQLGLFYALAESEDHAGALAQIEKIAAATPTTINAYSPATIQPNPATIRVQTARAMAPLLANRPGEAWERMAKLHAQAPQNMEAATAYGSTMRARGWPRLAEQQLRWSLAIDPYDSGALGERAGALLEMRDYRNAEAALASARAAGAEDGRVIRAGRLWDVHNLRELNVEAGFGRSAGGPTGNRDFSIDAHLYSQPLSYNYRAFLHLYSGQGTFDTGTGRLERGGVGLEYRSTNYVASAELTQDLNRSKTGVAASLAWMPNDFWTLRGLVDTNTTDTPMQARLAGVDAKRYGAEAVWRAHESRSAALGVDRIDFSDGNKRDIVQARWTERVIAGPVYKLEITPSIYTSRNSSSTAAYFNPSRDLAPSVEFVNEWLQWRRYTNAFRHRLALSVGNYQQQNFASGYTAGARYEQEWTADDRLILRYGIGRSLHPYDGVRVARNYAYVSLNWRF